MSETANARQDYRKPREDIDLAKDSPFPDQSAKHADAAVGHLIAAGATTDSRQREYEVRVAQVFASLALRDKMDELTATIKHGVSQLLDSQATLNENVKIAALTLHADAGDVRRELRLVREGEAA